MHFTVAGQGIDFEIHDDWWTEAGMSGFVPKSPAYDADAPTHGVAATVPVGEVTAPRRDPGVQWFGHDRMVSILRGLASGDRMPRIPVYEAPQDCRRYRPCDGFHRFYASIAAGFTHLPVEIVPRFEFETGSINAKPLPGQA